MMPEIKEEHTDIVYARVDAVVLLILENQKYMESNRNGELNKTICDKFGCAERTASRYMQYAKREVRRLGRAKKLKAFQRAIRDREFIIQKFKREDAKLALDAMKDRDKLQGLYEEKINQKVSVSLKDVNINSLTDEQLLKLREMLQKGVELKDALLHIGVIIK